MENFEETNIVLVVDDDEVNCEVSNPSSCKDVVLIECMCGFKHSNCEDRVEEGISRKILFFLFQFASCFLRSYILLNSSLMDKFGHHNDLRTSFSEVFYHLKGARQLTILFQGGSKKQLRYVIFSESSVQLVDKQG
ncbi:hypothetical protein M9H77_17416 [Catharanthus roseus]|uniref:Uncharacterized protein n=1 Tax=Catharanthus roseus TaxID=4058 RepID=A0ACC0B4J1_CATRO|nr:hypothetical protein M9H77_17416 [Catharanthus roseus]